jgi:hypothetical protein
MRDYKNGKIYAIKSYQTDEVYIGSTCEKYLSNRLKGHLYNYKEWKGGNRPYITSFLIIEKYPDYYIELIENCPCNNIDELRKRERYWIQSGEYKVVNKQIPGRTDKEYYQDNKSRLQEINNNYKKEKKEILAVKNKEYREKNIDIIKEKDKMKYEKNKDKISQRNAEKITCECGRVLTRGCLTRHLKKDIHMRTLLKKNNCFEEIFTYVNNK